MKLVSDMLGEGYSELQVPVVDENVNQDGGSSFIGVIVNNPKKEKAKQQ